MVEPKNIHTKAEAAEYYYRTTHPLHMVQQVCLECRTEQLRAPDKIDFTSDGKQVVWHFAPARCKNKKCTHMMATEKTASIMTFQTYMGRAF